MKNFIVSSIYDSTHILFCQNYDTKTLRSLILKKYPKLENFISNEENKKDYEKISEIKSKETKLLKDELYQEASQERERRWAIMVDFSFRLNKFNGEVFEVLNENNRNEFMSFLKVIYYKEEPV